MGRSPDGKPLSWARRYPALLRKSLRNVRTDAAPQTVDAVSRTSMMDGG